MNLQQLSYFKVVAELGHMTNAAQFLHISQPALSMSISALEAELGAPLFEKRGRALRLTSYGQVFLEHITKALNEIDLAEREVKRLKQIDKKTINLAAVFPLGASLLPELIREFSCRHDRTLFHIHQGPGLELVQQLADAKVDFVFGQTPPDQLLFKDIDARTLCAESPVVLLAKDHPLAGRPTLTLDDLQDETFLFCRQFPSHESELGAFLQEKQAAQSSVCHTQDYFSLAGLVAAGLGVSIAPAMFGTNEATGIAEVPIALPFSDEKRDIHLLWNRRAAEIGSPLYHEFLQFVLSAFGHGAEESF